LRHGSGPRPMLHSRMAAYLSIMTDLPTTIQLRSVAISRQWLAFPQLSVSGQCAHLTRRTMPYEDQDLPHKIARGLFESQMHAA
jgi:hypothetical protein